MTMLTFATIMLPGFARMGEKQNNGADIFDRFWPPSTPSGEPFDLGNVDRSMPSLLHFMTRSAHDPMNFVTWNAPHTVSAMSFRKAEEASRDNKASGGEGFLVGEIIRDSEEVYRTSHGPDEIRGHNWMQQTFRLEPGIIQSGANNILGIHSRNNGEIHNDRDNFDICNIYIMYHVL